MNPTKRGRLEAKRRQASSVVRAIQESYEFQTVQGTPLSPDPQMADYTVIGHADRYGFPVRLALCNQSGVVFLLDQLTPEDYSRLYRSGDYRRLIEAYKGRPDSGEALPTYVEAKAKVTADRTVDALRGLLSFPNGGRLLDIGGSSGDLSLAFRDAFNLSPTVIDPAQEELQVATQHGLDTRLGQFETIHFEPDETYEVIVLHQTLEHIMDLAGTMRRIRALLAPGGIFLFDFLDFLDQAAGAGCVEGASRLDHCHWLYYEMLDTFLGQTGFRRLLATRYRRSFCLVACKPCPPDPAATFDMRLGAQLVREWAIREVQFSNMDMFENFSRIERLKRRVGLKVTPF